MFKRALDILGAIVGLTSLAPLFLIIAVAIKIDSPGPIFFRQQRIGRNQVPFMIYKFRSMVTSQSKGASQITIGSDNRITKIGSFIRHYKIDELPQFINVLLGDMSLVGPRPEVAKYIEYYSAADKKIILSVRPGITDLASIKFRDENTILGRAEDPEHCYINKILPKKLALCRWYVKRQSFGLDLFIIYKTVRAVL